jgi:hypothetical protein
VDAGNHTQEVIVGEVTNDDVGLPCQALDGSEVRSELDRRTIFDEPGNRPRTAIETAFEVSAAYKK